MYKYVLNPVVKISMRLFKYFEYCTIILWGGAFLWTRCSNKMPYVFRDARPVKQKIGRFCGSKIGRNSKHFCDNR